MVLSENKNAPISNRGLVEAVIIHSKYTSPVIQRYIFFLFFANKNNKHVKS